MQEPVSYTHLKGAGTDVIRIRGVEKLHRTEYSIIPDQIEAGTFMFAAAATGGDVTVRNVIPKHLEATTAKLEEIGCEVEEFDDAVRVRAPHKLHRTHVKTLPYPGYPTDMQPQIAVTPVSYTHLDVYKRQDFSLGKEEIEKIFEKCGLPLNIRGEALTLEQFAMLANCIYEEKNNK